MDNYKILDEFIENHCCSLINMTHYDKWNDIIDAIASSSFIISESLQSLIVAEMFALKRTYVRMKEDCKIHGAPDSQAHTPSPSAQKTKPIHPYTHSRS